VAIAIVEGDQERSCVWKMTTREDRAWSAVAVVVVCAALAVAVAAGLMVGVKKHLTK
jgi:hypothetical protein